MMSFRRSLVVSTLSSVPSKPHRQGIHWPRRPKSFFNLCVWRSREGRQKKERKNKDLPRRKVRCLLDECKIPFVCMNFLVATKFIVATKLWKVRRFVDFHVLESPTVIRCLAYGKSITISDWNLFGLIRMIPKSEMHNSYTKAEPDGIYHGLSARPPRPS